MNLFEVKIRTERTLESGLVKKVTETFLVDALTPTEAEMRIRQLCEEIRIVTTIVGIREVKFFDIFQDPDSDYLFKCRVQLTVADERGGADKLTAITVLVRAQELTHAIEVLLQGMGGTLSDYEIVSITKTAIVDFIGL